VLQSNSKIDEDWKRKLRDLKREREIRKKEKIMARAGILFFFIKKVTCQL